MRWTKGYKYFISYWGKSVDGAGGHGRCTCILNHKIKSGKDIIKLEEDIRLDSGLECVAIMNYKMLSFVWSVELVAEMLLYISGSCYILSAFFG